MELNELLQEIGLSKGESKIYLALLELGSSSVTQLKDEVKLHRPNIYDYLDKLIEKGLVNFIVEENVKKFSAVNPEKLIEYLKEKEEIVKDFIPRLKAIRNKPVQEIRVEVYKGREGMKTFFNDLLKVGKDYVAFGIDESVWEKDFSISIMQHFRKERKISIKGRILTSENAKMIYKHGVYRYIDERFFSPTATTTYGDRVCTIIWEPLTVIIVTNKQVADSQRKYFELLWKIAKKRPKRRVRVVD